VVLSDDLHFKNCVVIVEWNAKGLPYPRVAERHLAFSEREGIAHKEHRLFDLQKPVACVTAETGVAKIDSRAAAQTQLRARFWGNVADRQATRALAAVEESVSLQLDVAVRHRIRAHRLTRSPDIVRVRFLEGSVMSIVYLI
jgi:hypothetical protein